MNEFSEKIREAAAKKHLTDAERKQMLWQMNAFIKENPVRERAAFRLQRWTRHFFSYFLTKRYMPALAVLIVFMLSLGTSAAAELALPGDLLYPVKVNINEELRGFASFSAEGKADWEVSRAERRLEEAEELAASGELTAEVQAKVEANFERFEKRVEERVSELKADGNVEAAAEISSRFESALSAHTDILERLDLEGNLLDSLRADVSAVSKAVSEIRADAEQAFSAKVEEQEKPKEEAKDTGSDRAEAAAEAAAEVRLRLRATTEAKIAAAEAEFVAAQDFAEEHQSEFSASIMAQVSAALEDCAKDLALARAKLETKAYGKAFALAQSAQRKARQSKLFLSGLLEIELNISGSIQSSAEGSAQGSGELRETNTTNLCRSGNRKKEICYYSLRITQKGMNNSTLQLLTC